VPMTRSLDTVAWRARTVRPSLRAATPLDVEPTWRFRNLAGVSRWLTCTPATLEEYHASSERPDRLATTLIIELDGDVIGDLMVAVEDSWSQAEAAQQARGVQAELGWVLRPDHVGHRCAAKAARELTRICFEDPGLRRVTAHCFADNAASWHLIERVGMRREPHTARDSLHHCGTWLDGMGYALLSDEWRTLMQRYPCETRWHRPPTTRLARAHAMAPWPVSW